MIFKFTVTDIVGNIYSVTTGNIGIYSLNDIITSYNAVASSIIAIDSCGEEFSAIAFDSFMERPQITVETVSGIFAHGNTVIYV